MVLCFFVCGILVILKSHDQSIGILVGSIFIIVSFFVLIMYCWECVKYARADRSWKVIINNEKLIWQAPKNLKGSLKENSFSLDLKEIEKIKTVIVSERTPDSSSRNYCYLVMKNNTEIELNLQNYLPMYQFIQAMSEVGITHEIIYEKN